MPLAVTQGLISLEELSGETAGNQGFPSHRVLRTSPFLFSRSPKHWAQVENLPGTGMVCRK